MTSSREPARQCYVYIWLPGATEAVTAGRYELEVNRSGRAVGRFVFGKSYRARDNAVEIDPVELALGPGTFQTTTSNGMFAALRDASPDAWGRRIIEHALRRTSLDEITYLLESPDDRAGALGFGLGQRPPAPKRKFNRTLDLARLQETADALLVDDVPQAQLGSDAVQVERLLLLGTSMGGARPKAVVEDGDALWIAKFGKSEDRWNHARVEHAMLELAAKAGIATAKSRIVTVGNRDCLLVKRFDRDWTADGYARARMTSGITLLRADDSALDRDRWSYVLLAEELRRVTTRPQANAHELFRRMAFNALTSNTDDHPRNHAIIARDRGWSLSPAYDLTPSNPVSDTRRDLALVCGDHGRWANAENLVSQARRFLLASKAAATIIDEVEAIVKSQWYATFRAAGVSERDCTLLAGAFGYPGFRLGADGAAPSGDGPPRPKRKARTRKAAPRRG